MHSNGGANACTNAAIVKHLVRWRRTRSSSTLTRPYAHAFQAKAPTQKVREFGQFGKRKLPAALGLPRIPSNRLGRRALFAPEPHEK
jgi:hypothetical protein